MSVNTIAAQLGEEVGLAAIIAEEMGKRIAEGVEEAEYCAEIFGYFVKNGAELSQDRPIESFAGGRAMVRSLPIGVLLGIMPWNFPYYQVARFAGPNLIIGNTVLLKHAPQCPHSAAAIEEIFTEAGAAGAYVNLYASHDQIETVIADPRVQGVSLTGSERAGAVVAEHAAVGVARQLERRG